MNLQTGLGIGSTAAKTAGGFLSRDPYARRTNRNLDQQYRLNEASGKRQAGLYRDLYQDYQNPMQGMNQILGALAPYLNQKSGQFGNQVGTDSGAYGGAMAKTKMQMSLQEILRQRGGMRNTLAGLA